MIFQHLEHQASNYYAIKCSMEVTNMHQNNLFTKQSAYIHTTEILTCASRCIGNHKGNHKIESHIVASTIKDKEASEERKIRPLSRNKRCHKQKEPPKIRAVISLVLGFEKHIVADFLPMLRDV